LGYYPVESIILNKDEWQEYLFEAYCMDITKSNIYNSTSFSLGPEAGQDVISMLTTANTIGPEIATVSAIQIALWALANDPSLDDLKERFNVDDQTIDNAWKILWEAQLYPSSLKMFEGYIPK